MSREIKFRAWDGKQILDLPDTCGYEEDCAMDYANRGPEEVMQYTGLKDKNGVEIYEGDVVRPISEKDKTYCNEVKFDIGALSILYKTPWFLFPEDHEVIGNIYENPELLGEKQ